MKEENSLLSLPLLAFAWSVTGVKRRYQNVATRVFRQIWLIMLSFKSTTHHTRHTGSHYSSRRLLLIDSSFVYLHSLRMALTPRSSAAVRDEKQRLSSSRQVNSTKLGQRGANGADDQNDVSRGLHKKGNAARSSLFFLMLFSVVAALLIVAMPWTAPASQQHHIRQRRLQPFNKDPKVTASVVSANPNFETAREGVDYSNEWGFRTMKKKLKCKEVFRQNGGQRPIYAQETWNYLRRLYRAVVEESTEQEESSITPEDAVTPTSGFLVPFQVRQVPGKGRGVFVLRDVKQGEPLWSTKHTARFQSGRDFRKFIFSLARDNGLACEVLDMWSKYTLVNTCTFPTYIRYSDTDAVT